MARCTGCGTELNKNSRFCHICGTAAAPAASPALSQTAMPAPRAGTNYPVAPGAYGAGATPQKDRRVLWASLGGGALVLVAGLLFAQASGILSTNKVENKPTGVLSAPPTQTAPAPILSTPPTDIPKSPILTPPTTVGNPMPEDVIAYLRWLKKFEQGRRDLSTQSAAVAATAFTKMSMGGLDKAMQMSDPDVETPTSKPQYSFMKDLNGLMQQWNGASSLFQQRTPPNPCAPLATTYLKALNDSVTENIKLLNIIGQIPEKAEKDPSSLMTLLTQLRGENGSKSISKAIDASYDSANTALDTLRDRYTSMPDDIDKSHFNVVEESHGTAPSPNIPGLGM